MTPTRPSTHPINPPTRPCAPFVAAHRVVVVWRSEFVEHPTCLEDRRHRVSGESGPASRRRGRFVPSPATTQRVERSVVPAPRETTPIEGERLHRLAQWRDGSHLVGDRPSLRHRIVLPRKQRQRVGPWTLRQPRSQGLESHAARPTLRPPTLRSTRNPGGTLGSWPPPTARGSELTLLGTRSIQRGGDIGEFESQQQPLLRGELPRFINLLLFQFPAQLTGSACTIGMRTGRGR